MYTEGVPTSVPWSRYAPSHKDRRTRQPYQIRVYKPTVRLQGTFLRPDSRSYLTQLYVIWRPYLLGGSTRATADRDLRARELVATCLRSRLATGW
jgi:hypothetical protein